MNNGCARILTERKDAFDSSFGIAQKLQCNIFVVLACLWVMEYFCHLEIVLAAQHKLNIMEALLRQQSQSLLTNLEDFLTLKLTNTDALLSQETILGLVFAKLKHWRILKFRICHIFSLYFKISIFKINFMVKHGSKISQHVRLDIPHGIFFFSILTDFGNPRPACRNIILVNSLT